MLPCLTKTSRSPSASGRGGQIPSLERLQEGVIDPVRGSNDASALTLDVLCRVHRSRGRRVGPGAGRSAGTWQSATSETYTSPLHPALTGGELYLKIDVLNDGSFRGEWGEYYCSGASLGAYGFMTFPCRFNGKSERVSGRFGPGRQGVIDLGRLGRSAFTWTAPSADEVAIDLPKNWQRGRDPVSGAADARWQRQAATRRHRQVTRGRCCPPTRSTGSSTRTPGALARHAGKTLVLEGRRGTLIELSDGGAAIHIADGFTSRALVLVFGDLREVSGISEGAQFRFRCTVESFDYLYLHLKDCSIVR